MPLQHLLDGLSVADALSEDKSIDAGGTLHLAPAGPIGRRRTYAGLTGAGGLYVCGWSKRGPQGTIGTNRACSYGMAEAVLADLPALAHRTLAAEQPLRGIGPAQYVGKYLGFQD